MGDVGTCPKKVWPQDISSFIVHFQPTDNQIKIKPLNKRLSSFGGF